MDDAGGSKACRLYKYNSGTGEMDIEELMNGNFSSGQYSFANNPYECQFQSPIFYDMQCSQRDCGYKCGTPHDNVCNGGGTCVNDKCHCTIDGNVFYSGDKCEYYGCGGFSENTENYLRLTLKEYQGEGSSCKGETNKLLFGVGKHALGSKPNRLYDMNENLFSFHKFDTPSCYVFSTIGRSAVYNFTLPFTWDQSTEKLYLFVQYCSTDGWTGRLDKLKIGDVVMKFSPLDYSDGTFVWDIQPSGWGGAEQATRIFKYDKDTGFLNVTESYLGKWELNNFGNYTIDSPYNCFVEYSRDLGCSEDCFFKCYNYFWDDKRVCSGHGNCTGNDKCTCHEGYSGLKCDCYYGSGENYIDILTGSSTSDGSPTSQLLIGFSDQQFNKLYETRVLKNCFNFTKGSAITMSFNLTRDYSSSDMFVILCFCNSNAWSSSLQRLFVNGTTYNFSYPEDYSPRKLTWSVEYWDFSDKARSCRLFKSTPGSTTLTLHDTAAGDGTHIATIYDCLLPDAYNIGCSAKSCSYFCHGKIANNESCSAHGDCIAKNNCTCESNYYGENCNVSICGPTKPNVTCNNYISMYTDDIYDWCDGISGKMWVSFASSKTGKPYQEFNIYESGCPVFGKRFTSNICFSQNSGVPIVNGHEDFFLNLCYCYDNSVCARPKEFKIDGVLYTFNYSMPNNTLIWSSEKDDVEGWERACRVFQANSDSKVLTEIESYQGGATSPYKIDDDPYRCYKPRSTSVGQCYSKPCDFKCAGIPFWNSSVCSGHGNCYGQDNCTCEAFYYGEYCEKRSCGSNSSKHYLAVHTVNLTVDEWAEGESKNDVIMVALASSKKAEFATNFLVDQSCKYLQPGSSDVFELDPYTWKQGQNQDLFVLICYASHDGWGSELIEMKLNDTTFTFLQDFEGYKTLHWSLDPADMGPSNKSCRLFELNEPLKRLEQKEAWPGNTNVPLTPYDCYLPGGYPRNFTQRDCAFYCYGQWWDKPSTCNSGWCSGHNNCSDCHYGYFGGNCNVTYTCNNSISTDEEKTCSGHGLCEATDHCDCVNSKYYSQFCDIWRCFNHTNNDTRVCSSHGSCFDHMNCSCLGNYTYEKDCSKWYCYGKQNDDSSVCSGHGNCYAHDSCNCSSGQYPGFRCHLWGCYGIPYDLDSKVCNGHGSCVNIDRCSCHGGYEGVECKDYYCDGKVPSDRSACNGRGYCTSPNSCQCFVDGYEGNLCGEWKCFDVLATASSVCSANGKCTEPGICDCSSGYYGENCDQSVALAVLLSLFIPSFTIISALLICIVSLIFCCIIMCLPLCFCCCCLLISTISIRMCCVVQRLKKFDELEDVELLISEQRMEKDSSMAHIKVDKDLFEIQYDDIKVVRIIGEGGSDATVFEAEWEGRTVAFKCFKTRLICSTQNNFDAFEREANLLASVSHPNIIQFYGCSLKPPRIGFLIEYCSHGDLTHYIGKKAMNEELISLDEKLRMLIEIASAMSYLHSRSIIHRDLKCENVLLNDNLVCKVMDFGESRMINNTQQAKTKGVGTCFYMAPEVVLGNRYNEKCDCFAMGILMWIVWFQDLQPYGDSTGFNIEHQVANNPYFRPSLKEKKVPKFLRDLMVTSWDEKPDKRISMKIILQLLKKNKDSVTDDTDEISGVEGSVDSDSNFVYLVEEGEESNRAERFFLPEMKYDTLHSMIGIRWKKKIKNLRSIYYSKSKSSKKLEDIEIEEDLSDQIEICKDEDLESIFEFGSDPLITVSFFDHKDLIIQKMEKEMEEMRKKMKQMEEELKNKKDLKE